MARKTSNYYLNVINRHQVYLEGLKSGYFKSFDQEIKKADKVIAEILNTLRVDTLQELTQTRFNELLKELRLVQLGMYSGQTEKLLKNLEELSAEEAIFEQQLLTESVVLAKGVKVNKAGNAWGKVSKNPIQSTGELLDPFVKNLSARQISRIERKIVTGRAQNWTISQIVKSIRGTKVRGYKDGVLGTNWNDCRTVVRTAVQHASTQARVATWEANSSLIDGYQWISTLDLNTSPQCRGLDLQVFQVGKGPLPPIHPGCRSTTAPYFKDDVELFGEGATRSSADGPIAAETNYYDWLKTQPEAFQNDAIGPVRGKLLREGGLSSKEFADLQLDRNFQPITLDEMKKLKPNAFEKAKL